MIEKGQTLVNPVTGERMTFLETAAETGGDRVVIELHADPGGSVAAAHVHPSQWETFAVVSGTLGAKVAGRTTEAGRGTCSSISMHVTMSKLSGCSSASASALISRYLTPRVAASNAWS